jgi:predicted nucleotidyltransferase
MISLKSDITKKVLNYYFINPKETLYVNEISRNLGLDKRNLVKKLNELAADGVLKVAPRGNLKFYSINEDFPLYNEYRKIVLSSVGFEHKLKNALKNVDGVSEAYIFGSYASGTMDSFSDIDLLLIGDHSIVKLQGVLNKLQKEIGREINTVNMDNKEFEKKKAAGDTFVREVLKKQHIKVL